MWSVHFIFSCFSFSFFWCHIYEVLFSFAYFMCFRWDVWYATHDGPLWLGYAHGPCCHGWCKMFCPHARVIDSILYVAMKHGAYNNMALNRRCLYYNCAEVDNIIKTSLSLRHVWQSFPLHLSLFLPSSLFLFATSSLVSFDSQLIFLVFDVWWNSETHDWFFSAESKAWILSRW